MCQLRCVKLLGFQVVVDDLFALVIVELGLFSYTGESIASSCVSGGAQTHTMYECWRGLDADQGNVWSFEQDHFHRRRHGLPHQENAGIGGETWAMHTDLVHIHCACSCMCVVTVAISRCDQVVVVWKKKTDRSTLVWLGKFSSVLLALFPNQSIIHRKVLNPSQTPSIFSTS